MSEYAAALAVAGPLVVAGAWLVIRTGRVSLWLVNGTVMPVLGVLAVLTGLVEWCPVFGAGRSVLIGLAGGAALYGATAAFMAVAGRWPPLARHTSALYRNRERISLSGAILVSTILVAPGEELLWRGVVLEALRSGLGAGRFAAVVAWAGYVAANAVSGSLPIILGAVVGGAAWTWLAVLTGGVVASIVCHIVWTGLMVAIPPVPRQR